MTKSITLWIVFLYSRSSATTPAINKAKHGPVDEMTHSRWILMCNIVFGTRKPTATNTSKHSTATAPSVASMPIATLSLLFNVRLNFINCSSLNDVINIRMLVPVVTLCYTVSQRLIYVDSQTGVNDSSCWERGYSTPCLYLNLALKGVQHYNHSTTILLQPGQLSIPAV